MSKTQTVIDSGQQIIIQFAPGPLCTMKTQEPEFAYWVFTWLTGRINYETLLGILASARPDLFEFLVNFTKACVGSAT